jgi:hypothetical protein
MSNVIDRLFEDVRLQLPPNGNNNFPQWPTLSEYELDKVDELGGSYEDKIITYDDYRNLTDVSIEVDDRREVFEPSSEDSEIFEGGIRTKGFEAIAFYKSKRTIDSLPCKGRWGIFYIKNGLDKLAWDISRSYPGYADPRELAHQFLFEHEHYHFQSDIQVLMFEALLKKHLYLPLRHALQGRKSHFVEEALANKKAYEWASKHSVGLREFAHDFMSLQPNAYSRFEQPKQLLSGEWLASAIDLMPPYSSPRLDIASWVGTLPKDLLRPALCPEYVVCPQKLSSWIDPAWVPPQVATITESPQFIKKLQDPKESLLAKKWAVTKPRLINDRFSNGLGFKPWPREGPNIYSVKVDAGFRAHLENLGSGRWAAIKIGNHKEMGHG